MKVSNAYQTRDEMESRKFLSELDEWGSRFNFLRAHHGYRVGRMHVILGPTSAGKSTLVRSLLLDAVSSGKKRVLLWLSEESIEEFLTELSFTNYEHEAMQNIKIVSEQDGAGEDGLFTSLRTLHGEFKPNLIIMDNITTSRFYNDKRPNEQSEFAFALKALGKELSVPMLIMCHTNAEVNGNMKTPINENHIRGSKTIVNLAEFFYCVQKVETESGGIFSFIRTVKHRGQDAKNKLHYLVYQNNGRVFTGDEPWSFEKFKEVLRKLP